MYITKVTIERIRCFKKIVIDLATTRGVRKWAMILGDNGVGKTTLLRCIAMGLCDEAGAVSLLRDTRGQWRMKGQDQLGRIKIELCHRRIKYSITSRIVETPSGLENIKQTVWSEKGEFPWDNIFVCGYGSNRRTEGSLDSDRYSPADAVYTLFNYDWPLQNPELVLRRRAKTKTEQDKICSSIDSVLMLKSGSTQLIDKGIFIKGDWDKDIHLGAVGDGYSATLIWILDMLGWAMLARQLQKGTGLSGIVLIDEIEQHLHPRWQRHIVRLLRTTFRNIQFITTTHTPLCAGGTADLDEEDYKLILLKRGDDSLVNRVDKLPSLGGYRVDQILASELFDYIIETNDGTEKLLRKASILAGKGKRRTKTENAIYKKIKNELKSILISDGTTLIERELSQGQEEEITKKIRKLEKKLFGKGK